MSDPYGEDASAFFAAYTGLPLMSRPGLYNDIAIRRAAALLGEMEDRPNGSARTVLKYVIKALRQSNRYTT